VSVAISIRAVKKVYGSGPQAVNALDHIDLDINDSEFFTLLGPSGCGKTTLLRLIGGFEQPTQGEILLYDEHLEGLEPNERSVNTVFQSYSLFPHMTIAENIAFGLKMKGQSKSQVDSTVAEMLNLVQMEDYGNRKPNQLSGGQQQRIALARALAPKPKVLLLDEPLSALDLKLRQAMRTELKNLQKQMGITFVFVTHDQEEALTMSDRIAVMSNGELQQVGTGREIYEEPQNRFVADFIGETNLLSAVVEKIKDKKAICNLGGQSQLECSVVGDIKVNSEAVVSIRPERISIVKASKKDKLTGVVDRFIYLGTDTQCILHLENGSEINVRVQNAHDSALNFDTGDRVAIKIDDGAARLLVN